MLQVRLQILDFQMVQAVYLLTALEPRILKLHKRLVNQYMVWVNVTQEAVVI